MKKRCDHYLTNKNVVYSDWENTPEQVKEKVKERFNIDININSVTGFSKGGRRAWPAVGKYNFVGLIDPSIEGSDPPSITPTTKAILIYMQGRDWLMPALMKAVRALGPKRSFVVASSSHWDQVDTFLTNYANYL